MRLNVEAHCHCQSQLPVSVTAPAFNPNAVFLPLFLLIYTIEGIIAPVLVRRVPGSHVRFAGIPQFAQSIFVGDTHLNASAGKFKCLMISPAFASSICVVFATFVRLSDA